MSKILSIGEFLRRFPVAIRLPVQWGDMDAFQHLNNVIYFRYQESSRIKCFEALMNEIKDPAFDRKGFLSGTGLGPILADTSGKFVYPVVCGDTLLIGATVEMIEGPRKNRFRMLHSMWSLSKNRIVFEGTGTIASFNYSKGKAEDFDPRVIQAIHSLSTKNSVGSEDILSKPINHYDNFF
jgi:acyl-CoA thioester hydrolase